MVRNGSDEEVGAIFKKHQGVRTGRLGSGCNMKTKVDSWRHAASRVYVAGGELIRSPWDGSGMAGMLTTTTSMDGNECK